MNTSSTYQQSSVKQQEKISKTLRNLLNLRLSVMGPVTFDVFTAKRFDHDCIMELFFLKKKLTCDFLCKNKKYLYTCVDWEIIFQKLSHFCK